MAAGGLTVQGYPDRNERKGEDDGVQFLAEPRFCPGCGSQNLLGHRWYGSDGGTLHAECGECGCHFGVSGVWADPGDYDCDHTWATQVEDDGITPAGRERCIKCGVDKKT